ncbi:DUF488 domain-containing protein [Streptomyces sp. NPDC059629]|uniref:DUF488 domain-containing protein n=1 Tax=Streptomyces sp. NPDC059629 TaxID=3346889 RepID=UPI003698E343
MLVDRLRPRGMRTERAHPDEWLRDVTSSADLRHRHHHDQERFAEFGDRYIGELEDADHRPAVQHLRDLAARDKVTLLTATKDVGPGEAAVARPVARRRRHSEPLDPSLRHPAGLADCAAAGSYPEDFASPLGKRVYDLPHTRRTDWLIDGVPPAQVTEWAANGVPALPSTYARCIVDRLDELKTRVEAAGDRLCPPKWCTGLT